MTNPLQILESVRIASPCPVPWEDMEGGDHVRHCGQCDCRVYNLSTVTAEEGMRILRETEGRLCVQLWRRADGTLITTDCPVGLREKMRRLRRKVSAVAAMVASYFVLPGCSSDAPSNYGTPPFSTAPDPNGPTASNTRSSAEFTRRNGLSADPASCLGGYVYRPNSK